MIEQRLRVAVVGTGGIIRGYHLPALRNDVRVEIAGAANQHFDSLNLMAKEEGISKLYERFEDLAADSSIGAVVIGTPNYLNAKLSIMLLQSGKHVLCEKPMATSLEDAQQMVDESEKSGCLLMIAHVWRSDPDMQWLKAIVESGTLGEVYKVKLHAVSAGWGPPAGSWRTRKELAGGGALTDVGVHSLDTLAFLFGDRLCARRVFARTSNRFMNMEVEDSAVVLIECADGMVVTMDAGWYEPNVQSLHGAVELYGDKGFARILPADLRVSEDVSRSRLPPPPERRHHVALSMYVDQMRNFIDAILNGEKPVCGPRDALASIELLDAAYRSAELGEIVALSLRERQKGGREWN
jgi:predicted dehydrogenase